MGTCLGLISYRGLLNIATTITLFLIPWKKYIMADTSKIGIGYYKGLDFLRFMAAVCVIIRHVSEFLMSKGVVLGWHKYHLYSGAFSLDLFFVISGLLIGRILFQELDSGGLNLKYFFIRRILRIWPLFFLVVLLKVFVAPYLRGVDSDEIIKNLSYAFTFTTNFQLIFDEYFKSTYKIIWSVCIEEQFYLIIPFLGILFKQRRMEMVAILILAGLGSIYFSGEIFTSKTDLPVPYFFSGSYLYYFGIGVLLAIIMSRYKSYFEQFVVVATNRLVQLIILPIGFMLVFNVFGQDSYTLHAVVALTGLFGAYLVVLAMSGRFLFNEMSDSIFRYLGNISYGMYLIHPIVLGISYGLFAFVIKEPGFMSYTYIYPLMTIVFTVLIATVLYYLIERRFIRLKRKFSIVKNK